MGVQTATGIRSGQATPSVDRLRNKPSIILPRAGPPQHDMAFDETYDVVVVGGGNAGFSAATTAAQAGARVCLVEKAPLDDAGGNTFYTAAAFRCCFDGLPDLLPHLYHSDGTKGLPQELIDNIEMTPYTKANFHAVSFLVINLKGLGLTQKTRISDESLKGEQTRCWRIYS